MKKHPFSLIEIVIALPLIAILFSSLLFHFSSTLYFKNKLTEMHKEVLDDRYFRVRLQKMLYQDAKNFYFQQGILRFDYHNRASINPKACGKVTATLQAIDQSVILKVYHVSKAGIEELIREEKFFNEVEELKWDYIYEFKQEKAASPIDSSCPFYINTYQALQPSNAKDLAALELKVVKSKKSKKQKEDIKEEVTYFFNLLPSLEAL